MAKMTKAQRTAILEAHSYRVNHPNGQRDGHIRTQSGARNQMIMRMITARLLDLEGRVTLAALRAAGVDIDAIHAEASNVNRMITHNRDQHARTVTVPDLTAQLGFPPHDQADTAAWAGVRHDHRWTEAEAADLIHIWHNPGTRHVGDGKTRV